MHKVRVIFVPSLVMNLVRLRLVAAARLAIASRHYFIETFSYYSDPPRRGMNQSLPNHSLPAVNPAFPRNNSLSLFFDGRHGIRTMGQQTIHHRILSTCVLFQTIWRGTIRYNVRANRTRRQVESNPRTDSSQSKLGKDCQNDDKNDNERSTQGKDEFLVFFFFVNFFCFETTVSNAK